MLDRAGMWDRRYVKQIYSCFVYGLAGMRGTIVVCPEIFKCNRMSGNGVRMNGYGVLGYGNASSRSEIAFARSEIAFARSGMSSKHTEIASTHTSLNCVRKFDGQHTKSYSPFIIILRIADRSANKYPFLQPLVCAFRSSTFMQNISNGKFIFLQINMLFHFLLTLY